MRTHWRRAAVIVPLVALGACSSAADASLQQEIPGDLAGEIARRIEVRESPALFTLFAMLNAAGYDEETRGEMHPVRRAVRSTLPRVLPDSMFARADAFYKRHPGTQLWTYSVIALATSGPPSFAPTPAWTNDLSKEPGFKGYADLPPLLRDFNRAFRADSIYRTHQLAYRAYIADYNAVIKREVTAVLHYARVANASELRGVGDHKRVVVIPNLLMSYDRSYSFALDSTFYSVEGPQAVVRYVPHEFIHAVTKPLAEDSASADVIRDKVASVYASVRNRTGVRDIGSATAFADECLVRAIALRYVAARDPERDARQQSAAEADAREGLVLVPYFYDQLKAYERQRAPLREYFPKLLDGLDALRELNRWRPPGEAPISAPR